MIKKIAILALLMFFAAGAVTLMAESNSPRKGKGALQSVYNWFGSWDRLCVDKSVRCCKACGRKCCNACNMDCGGTCCSDCARK